jgi:putative (di)nucleoside polyphosphate hydrolase
MLRIRRAVGAFVRWERKYLLVHKVKVMDAPDGPEVHTGLWDVPKGGIKPGETALEALIREVREETGMYHFQVQTQFEEPLRFAFEHSLAQQIGYDLQETTMFLLEYRGDGSDLRPLDEEIDQVCFFPLEAFTQHLTHPETASYFRRIVLHKAWLP